MLRIKLIIKYCVSCWITDILQNDIRSIQHQILSCLDISNRLWGAAQPSTEWVPEAFSPLLGVTQSSSGRYEENKHIFLLPGI